jgi:hypothetical protein
MIEVELRLMMAPLVALVVVSNQVHAAQLQVEFGSTHHALNAGDAAGIRAPSPQAKVTAHGKDPATVHEVWDECRTIVTANEALFIRYMLEHQKRDSNTRCQDCLGLLVVPASAIVREQLLQKVKKGVPVNGQIIPWRAVAYANLCMSLHTMVPSGYGVSDAALTVRRTPRSRRIGTRACRKSARAPNEARRRKPR